MPAFSSSNQPQLLERECILGHLAARPGWTAPELHVFQEVDSTNRAIRQFTGDRVAVLAESQTHGRGRRGRRWVATPRQNILLSVSNTLARPLAQIGGLSLAAGVSVVEALRECGVTDVGLKWPNDLMIGRAKLGGVLVETGTVQGRLRVVIGLGLNVWLADTDIGALPGEVIDLYRHSGRLVDRNLLAACAIRQLFQMLEQFENAGFTVFRQRWESAHVFQRKRVTLILPQGSLSGIAAGIDGAGRLALRADSGETSYWQTGEVSLRA